MVKALGFRWTKKFPYKICVNRYSILSYVYVYCLSAYILSFRFCPRTGHLSNCGGCHPGKFTKVMVVLVLIMVVVMLVVMVVGAKNLHQKATWHVQPHLWSRKLFNLRPGPHRLAKLSAQQGCLLCEEKSGLPAEELQATIAGPSNLWRCPPQHTWSG